MVRDAGAAINGGAHQSPRCIANRLCASAEKQRRMVNTFNLALLRAAYLSPLFLRQHILRAPRASITHRHAARCLYITLRYYACVPRFTAVLTHTSSLRFCTSAVFFFFFFFFFFHAHGARIVSCWTRIAKRFSKTALYRQRTSALNCMKKKKSKTISEISVAGHGKGGKYMKINNGENQRQAYHE